MDEKERVSIFEGLLHSVQVFRKNAATVSSMMRTTSKKC
jgi:hypothetical protein